ncbi:MAG: retron St85 family RNA-directed DNA polymerase [Verrucomicrobiae bacterium]|nr:retron St85 family RNA-directed DNA polymerase [Verrucomicrobiae bacterium]
MKTLIDSVALLSGLTRPEVIAIAEKAPRTYRKYDIPKKKTGHRRISHPAKETKLLQYAVIDLLLAKMPVHHAAVGFIPGLKSPLKENATRHAKNAFMLRADFKDFFPSIRPTDFYAALAAAPGNLGLEITTADKEFLKKVLFVKDHDGSLGLPIGAPTSPIVSNVVMIELDREIQALSERHDTTYTRYADDLVFSTSTKDISATVLNELNELLAATAIPNLQLNHDKTHFMSRNCRRAVTGLVITPS